MQTYFGIRFCLSYSYPLPGGKKEKRPVKKQVKKINYGHDYYKYIFFSVG